MRDSLRAERILSKARREGECLVWTGIYVGGRVRAVHLRGSRAQQVALSGSNLYEAGDGRRRCRACMSHRVG